MWTWPATGRTFTKYPSHTWMSIPLPLTTFTCCCRVWGLETRKPLSTCWSPWSSSSGLWGLQWLSFYTPRFFATLSPCHNEVAEGGYRCWNQLVCLAVFMHAVGQNHKHMYNSLQCAYTCTPPPPPPNPWPSYTEWEVDTVLTRQGSTRCTLLAGFGLAFNIFTYCTPLPTPTPYHHHHGDGKCILRYCPPHTPCTQKRKKKKRWRRHDMIYIYMAGWKLYFDILQPPPPKKKWQQKTTKHCLSLHLIFLRISPLPPPPPPPPPTPPPSPRNHREGQGTTRDVHSRVGLKMCQALAAYKDGDFAEAVKLVYPLRYEICALGGSHAQVGLQAWQNFSVWFVAVTIRHGQGLL